VKEKYLNILKEIKNPPFYLKNVIKNIKKTIKEL
jgi:hypothetical protein